MTKVSSRLDTGLTVVTGKSHLEVEVGMDRIMDRIIDRIMEEDCCILTVIEMTLGEDILEKCKIIVVRVIEVDVETIAETTIEIITETTIVEEVEVGLEKNCIWVILEGMIKAVADLDQVQEPVQTEIGLDVLNVENMTILLMTVLNQTQRENQSKFSKCTT